MTLDPNPTLPATETTWPPNDPATRRTVPATSTPLDQARVAELAAIEANYPKFYPQILDRYNRICAGARDLYF